MFGSKGWMFEAGSADAGDAFGIVTAQGGLPIWQYICLKL
jgi:hypothetical protein